MLVIVAGPPCSGKSSYIDEHWKPGDLVVDYDEVMAVFTRRPMHAFCEEAHYPVFSAAQAATQELARANYSGTAYFPVGGHARQQTLKKLMPFARQIVIDPGKEACLNRATARNDGGRARAGIEAWYER